MKNIFGKQMRFTTKELINSGVSGAFWITIGLTNRIESLAIPVKIIVCLFFVLYITIVISSFFIKFENKDERAEINQGKAYKNATIIFCSIATFLALWSTLKDQWMVNLSVLLPIALGLIQIFYFINFIILEKVDIKH